MKKEWEHGRRKSQPTLTTLQRNQIFTSFYANFPTRCKALSPPLHVFFTCDTAGRKGATEARLPEKGTSSTQFGVKQPKDRISLCVSLLLLQPYLFHLLLLLRLPSDLINLLAPLLKLQALWGNIEDLISCSCFSCWILQDCLHRHFLPALAQCSTWREMFKLVEFPFISQWIWQTCWKLTWL